MNDVLASPLDDPAQALRAIVSASPIAILALDLEARITMWNPAAERIFGWRADEVLGRRYPLVPEPLWGEFLPLFRRVIGGEGFAELEARRLRKDGRMIDVSMSTAPIRAASGRVVGAMAILADISDRKRLEAEVRQAQKMELVGQLAGGLAHDFNNLLTVIVGASSILLSGLRPDDPLRREVLDIDRAAERAAQLTKRLLALGRRQLVQPKALDLDAVVRGMRELLARMLREDIGLHTELGLPSGSVKADVGQLEQVLMNLAVNARDAMPSGGSLTIATRPRSVRGAEYAELSVTDTGVGMEPEVLRRLFEPFFTTKDAASGSGLGLTIVEGIVRGSGGFVEVDSAPGAGSTFRVYLPLSSDDAARPREVDEAEEPRGDERILLVEDNELVRPITRRILESLGYRVHEADGGAAAIRVFESTPIDLVLTDVVMHGMSGRELAERLSARRPDLKVVFMSGYTDDAVLGRSVRGEAVAFLGKPFSRLELAAKLREALDGPTRRGR